MADSNQQVVQMATAALKLAIGNSPTFASWVGFEHFQKTGNLQEAINIVNEIEAGHYSLNDLFNSAQSKISGTYASGINGEPNPTLTVNGQTFDIGHLLGDTKVEQWSSGGKNPQYDSREYFTTVGTDEPKDYVDGWENPNKAPEVSVGAEVVDEDSVLNDSVAHYATDVNGDALTFSLKAPVAGLTFNDDGSYSFDAGNVAYQHLAAGDKLPISVNFIVADGKGGLTESTLTITVTGANDAPTAEAVTGSINENGSAITVKADFDDVDTKDTHTVAIDTDGTVGQVTDNRDGTFVYDANGKFESLAAGQSTTDTFTYTVNDGQGGTDTATVSIIINGENDGPVAKADTNAGNEDAIITGNVGSNDTDVDNGAVLKYRLDAPVAGLIINEDGTYSLDASHADYQDIHLGDTRLITANYTVTDEHGASATSTLSITLTGTADKYHGVADVSQSFIKTAVNSGNGDQTAESFHFDLSLPEIENSFNFTGKVTLKVTGDIDGKNENATAVAISGELVDENASEPGLIYLSGTLGNNDDKGAADNGDFFMESATTNVGANGFADGHVVFDVNVSGDVDFGAVISATLSYDFWM